MTKLIIWIALTCSDPASAAAPVGALDAVDASNNALGWAADPDIPAAAINVHFYVDGPAGAGTFAGLATADRTRPDVGRHVFAFKLPEKFQDGKKHNLYAYGIDATGGDNSLLAGTPRTFQLNRAPVGALDAVDASNNAHGWAADPDAPAAAIDVHFYVDGPAGAGTFAGLATANATRPDVGEHVFAFKLKLPEKFRDGKDHQLYAYGIDTAGGDNPLLAGTPRIFRLNRAPVGALDAVDASGNARGWAADPDAPTAAIDVHFYVGGPAGAGTYAGSVTANDEERSDVKAAGYPGNHTFAFKLPEQFWDGKDHELYAYGIDTAGGDNPLLGGMSKPFTLTAHAVADPPASGPGGAVTIPPGGLRYFGYVDPPMLADPVAAAIEWADWSNVGFIQAQTVSAETFARLSRAGVKAVIDLSRLLFVPQADSVAPSGGRRHVLAPDYAARWTEFAGRQILADHAADILGFYIVDEPTWSGVSAADLKAAADLVKRSFPAAPTMLFEAAPSLKDLQIPDSIDWVGFDQYGLRDPGTSTEYRANHALLKSKRSSTQQRLMVVFDAFWSAEIHGAKGISQNDLAATAANYYAFAASDPDIIAIAAFSWSSFTEGTTNMVGTKDLPVPVRDEHRRIGQLVTRKTGAPSAGPAAPTASIKAPLPGATVRDTVRVEVDAAPADGVSKVELYVDGALRAAVSAAPYVFLWQAPDEKPGQHTLLVKAYDAAGRQGDSAPVTVTVAPAADTAPPKVTVTVPGAAFIGGPVSGMVRISATATDDTRVAEVEFSVDGISQGAISAPPYDFAWDTTKVANGEHTVSATASDAADNSARHEVTVTVNNRPANGAQFVSQSVPATANAGEPVTISVTMKNTGSSTWTRAGKYCLASGANIGGFPVRSQDSPGAELDPAEAIAPGQTKVFSFSVVLSAPPETAELKWRMLVEGEEWFGDLTPGARVAVSVPAAAPAADTTPPKVTVTVPVAAFFGGPVSGMVRISATATDDTRVTEVKFSVDGISQGAISAPPYDFAWDTTKVANGEHTVSATASDAADNSARHEVTVTVNNRPANGAQFVSQSVPAAATAGEPVTISVTMKNTGSSTWTRAGKYCLASGANIGGFPVRSQDSPGADLDPAEAIAPGQTKVFSFSVVLSAPPETAELKWRMLVEGEEWFGDPTPGARVAVSVPAAAPAADTTPPKVTVKVPDAAFFGGPLSGLVTLTADATDDRGVTEVKFFVDGVVMAGITGSQYAYSWNTADFSNGPHDVAVQAFDAAGNSASDGTSVRVDNPPANDAQFVSQSVPATANAGEPVMISVTMKNTGASTWTRVGRYSLAGGSILGDFPVRAADVQSAELGPTDAIAPGQTKTFTFTVVLSTPPETAEFKWRMLVGANEHFGDSTPGTRVTVIVPPGNSHVDGDAMLSAPAAGDMLVIRTFDGLAGAIGSLAWKGREFLNAWDHGRGLQSAASFDGWGECLNPTEAGSMDDGGGPTSTSQLLALSVSGDTLVSRTRMANWLKPGQTGICPPGVTARNAGALSDDVLEKRVRLGAFGFDNVIEYAVTFSVAQGHDSAAFEAVTGYMPGEFSEFWYFHPTTGELAPLSDGPGEQGLPVVFATPGGESAMGVYSPELPQTDWTGYGRFRYHSPEPAQSTNKWNCAFRRGSTPPGNYTYSCFVIFGSREQVRASLLRLHEHFHPAPIPISQPPDISGPWSVDFLEARARLEFPSAVLPPGSKASVSVGLESHADPVSEERKERSRRILGLVRAREGVELGPHGLSLERPVVIRLTVAPCDGRKAGLYHWNAAQASWEAVPDSRFDAQACEVYASLRQLSSYAAFYNEQAAPAARAALGEVYAFPNPAVRKDPRLHVEAPSADRLKVRIYDVAGNLVHTGELAGPPGSVTRAGRTAPAFEYAWSAGAAPSGVYLYEVEVSGPGGSARRWGKLAVVH